MIQNNSHLLNWLVTDHQRVKARIKYELKQLELYLVRLYKVNITLRECPQEVVLIFQELANKYSDYSKLLGCADKESTADFDQSIKGLCWQDYVHILIKLKNSLSIASDLEDEKILISEITTLLIHFNSEVDFCRMLNHTNHRPCKNNVLFKQLFQTSELVSWLFSLIDFINDQDSFQIESIFSFQNWSVKQLQLGLDFLIKDEVVSFVNSLFYYKLNPAELYQGVIHPEKLVSVRERIGFLYSVIEQLQKELFAMAHHKGLTPDVDYLFHGDELPQGIKIEIKDSFNDLIQSALGELRRHFIIDKQAQYPLDRLKDLYRAYKYWFNPNRLIDASMVLRQQLIPENGREDNMLLHFQEELAKLFDHWGTTECLDLYGYFTNKDTRCLMFTLFSITHCYPLDRLPPLSDNELSTVLRVYQTLKSVMEGLRIELQNRHVITEPYDFELETQYLHSGRINRDAVFRLIAIYGGDAMADRNTLDQLFYSIEDKYLSRC